MTIEREMEIKSLDKSSKGLERDRNRELDRKALH